MKGEIHVVGNRLEEAWQYAEKAWLGFKSSPTLQTFLLWTESEVAYLRAEAEDEGGELVGFKLCFDTKTSHGPLPMLSPFAHALRVGRQKGVQKYSVDEVDKLLS